MDPQTRHVLYSKHTQRRQILNYWIRISALIDDTPDEIVILCIDFSNNPYKDRLEFKVGEKVGYIKTNPYKRGQYIETAIVSIITIGCRVALWIPSPVFKQDENEEYAGLDYNTYYVQLPSDKIDPSLISDNESPGLDTYATVDKILKLASGGQVSVKWKVPARFVEISI